jgi:hypothetical protein
MSGAILSAAKPVEALDTTQQRFLSQFAPKRDTLGGLRMSDQIIALLITFSLFILMCVWVPLLDNIAIRVRRWTLVRRLENFLVSETFVEDFALAPSRLPERRCRETGSAAHSLRH